MTQLSDVLITSMSHIVEETDCEQMAANPLNLAKRIYVGRPRAQNEIDRFLGTKLLEKAYGYETF